MSEKTVPAAIPVELVEVGDTVATIVGPAEVLPADPAKAGEYAARVRLANSRYAEGEAMKTVTLPDRSTVGATFVVPDPSAAAGQGVSTVSSPRPPSKRPRAIWHEIANLNREITEVMIIPYWGTIQKVTVFDCDGDPASVSQVPVPGVTWRLAPFGAPYPCQMTDANQGLSYLEQDKNPGQDDE